MIFIIPCKYNPNCLIENTVESIARFHPKAKIVVVDSDSEDKSYFSRINHAAMVINEGNKNYEPGALWRVFGTFKDEHYILVQDSMVFKKSIEDIVNETRMMKCFINFYEHTNQNHMRIPREEYINGLNKMMGLTEDTDDYGFVGVFGSSFIASRKFIQGLYDMGLNATLLPTNKFEHQMAERVFGLAALDMGVDLNNNTIIGNLHELMSGPGFNSTTETLHTEVFDKTWNNKHRQ